MVSFDGGSTYRDVLRLTDADVEENWPRVVRKMDPALLKQIEAELPGEPPRMLLARYLELSNSHLVVD
jgi:hypothetical protein